MLSQQNVRHKKYKGLVLVHPESILYDVLHHSKFTEFAIYGVFCDMADLIESVV